MKRTIVTVAALGAALVPAAAGLWGNASFSQAVPVRVPASAQVVRPAVPGAGPTTPTSTRTTEAADDHGGGTPRDQRSEPGDDREAARPTGTRTTGTRTTGTRTTGAGDDHGGATPRDQRTEPGDDRGSDSTVGTSPGSGTSGGSDDAPSGGSDDRTSSGSGSDDHGGHGGDDSGSHDHGGDD